MHRADHPSSCKTEGASIFRKITLPLRVSKCTVSITNKIRQNLPFFHLHRSTYQTQDKFQIFKSNLELNDDSLCSCNPFLTVIIGDFNAKSKQWCKIDKTSFEGSQLQLVTSKVGLLQMITEPTHILENSRRVLFVKN